MRTELEAMVQLVAALGVSRWVAGNLVFAKDREVTLKNAKWVAPELPGPSASTSAPSLAGFPC